MTCVFFPVKRLTKSHIFVPNGYNLQYEGMSSYNSAPAEKMLEKSRYFFFRQICRRWKQIVVGKSCLAKKEHKCTKHDRDKLSYYYLPGLHISPMILLFIFSSFRIWRPLSSFRSLFVLFGKSAECVNQSSTSPIPPGERRNGVDSALIPDFAMEGDDGAASSSSLPPDAGVVLLPSAAIARRARQDQGFVKFDGIPCCVKCTVKCLRLCTHLPRPVDDQSFMYHCSVLRTLLKTFLPKSSCDYGLLLVTWAVLFLQYFITIALKKISVWCFRLFLRVSLSNRSRSGKVLD